MANIPLLPPDISVLGLLGAIVLFVSPVMIVVTFRRNINVTRLRMCHELAERHMELMWLTVERPELNRVWDRIPKGRLQELSQAQSKKRWGAWHIMTKEERNSYRFARRALEHVEQAFDAYNDGWMPANLWSSWEARLHAWKDCDYTIFIAGDLRQFKQDRPFYNQIR